MVDPKMFLKSFVVWLVILWTVEQSSNRSVSNDWRGAWQEAIWEESAKASATSAHSRIEWALLWWKVWLCLRRLLRRSLIQRNDPSHTASRCLPVLSRLADLERSAFLSLECYLFCLLKNSLSHPHPICLPIYSTIPLCPCIPGEYILHSCFHLTSWGRVSHIVELAKPNL